MSDLPQQYSTDVTCAKCGKRLGRLVFPGGECVDCHAKRFDERVLYQRITERPVAPIEGAEGARQWLPSPDFVPCKRSPRTGQKLRWRTYYGYKPAGLWYPAMTGRALRRQARLYGDWIKQRDAAREAAD